MSNEDKQYMVRQIEALESIAASLERTAPSGSVPEPCCPTRAAGSQGDPLTSGSELALPDQAKAMEVGERLDAFEEWEASVEGRVQWKRLDGTHTFGDIRAFAYASFLAGAEAQRVRTAAEAQSAAVEAQAGPFRAGGWHFDSNGRIARNRPTNPPAEAEGASGSGNGAAVPPVGGEE